MARGFAFETRSPHPFRCLVSLGGSRMLAAFGNTAMVSEDAGRSWGEPFEATMRGASSDSGGPEAQTDVGSLAPMPGGIVSVTRLARGKPGGVQRLPVALPGEYRHVGLGRMCFVVSSDEGRTWEHRGDVSLPVDNVVPMEGAMPLLDVDGLVVRASLRQLLDGDPCLLSGEDHETLAFRSAAAV